MDLKERKPKQNPAALLPILVFLALYLGMGLVFEYGLGVEMAFYNIPIVVVFMVALLVACLQNRVLKFDDKLAIMAQGVGDKNIMTMILIFLVAGVFVGVTGRSSAEAVAYFLLSVTPAWASVAVLFVAACFVSTAMGTSVGTITLITPIAAAVSNVSGFSMALCVGSVMGGAMFGDNLSFISDTTIAACNTQGCEMRDKFRANFKIALPAAVVTLVVILVQSLSAGVDQIDIPEYNLLLLIPYILVLFGGIVGLNVFVVLLVGILAGVAIVLPTGTVDIATANNTVAIVMAGPIAKEISEEYGITPKESASLLDTFSCVFQGVIPYGAQMLVAISASGGAVSAFQIMPCLYYPYLLAAACVVYILVGAGKGKK